MAATSSGGRPRGAAQKDGAPAERDGGTRPRASSRAVGSDSEGIVEDNADGVPLARIELADTMVQLHLIVAAQPLRRAIVDREDCRVAFPEREDHGAGLH